MLSLFLLTSKIEKDKKKWYLEPFKRTAKYEISNWWKNWEVEKLIIFPKWTLNMKKDGLKQAEMLKGWNDEWV